MKFALSGQAMSMKHIWRARPATMVHTLPLAHMGLPGAFRVHQDSTTMTRPLPLLANCVQLAKRKAMLSRSLAKIVQSANISKTPEKPSVGTVQVADGLTQPVHLHI